MHGDPFGTHRVIEPRGALPQPAWRLDNDASRRFETEIHVAVETLNLDAASFRQLETASHGRDEDIALPRSCCRRSKTAANSTIR
jgi:L-erythro-3,5-diaminohexanoate dehydrogenase